jgi:hypothetical protein
VHRYDAGGRGRLGLREADDADQEVLVDGLGDLTGEAEQQRDHARDGAEQQVEPEVDPPAGRGVVLHVVAALLAQVFGVERSAVQAEVEVEVVGNGQLPSTAGATAVWT